MVALTPESDLAQKMVEHQHALHLRQLVARYIPMLEAKKKQAWWGKSTIQKAIDSLEEMVKAEAINELKVAKALTQAVKQSYVFSGAVLAEIAQDLGEARRFSPTEVNETVEKQIASMLDNIDDRIVAGEESCCKEIEGCWKQSLNLLDSELKTFVGEQEAQDRVLITLEENKPGDAFDSVYSQVTNDCDRLQAQVQAVSDQVTNKKTGYITDDQGALLDAIDTKRLGISQALAQVHTTVEALKQDCQATRQSIEEILPLAADPTEEQLNSIDIVKQQIEEIKTQHQQQCSEVTRLFRADDLSRPLVTNLQQRANHCLVNQIESLLYARYPHCLPKQANLDKEQVRAGFFVALQKKNGYSLGEIHFISELLSINPYPENFSGEFNEKVDKVVTLVRSKAYLSWWPFDKNSRLADRLARFRINEKRDRSAVTAMVNSTMVSCRGFVQLHADAVKDKLEKTTAGFIASLKLPDLRWVGEMKTKYKVLNQVKIALNATNKKRSLWQKVVDLKNRLTGQLASVSQLSTKIHQCEEALSQAEHGKMSRYFSLKQVCHKRLGELSINDRVVAQRRLKMGVYTPLAVAESENDPLSPPDDFLDGVVVPTCQRSLCAAAYAAVHDKPAFLSSSKARHVALLRAEYELAVLLDAYTTKGAAYCATLDLQKVQINDSPLIQSDKAHNERVLQYLQQAHRCARSAVLRYEKKHPELSVDANQLLVFKLKDDGELAKEVGEFVDQAVRLEQEINCDQQEVEDKWVGAFVSGLSNCMLSTSPTKTKSFASDAAHFVNSRTPAVQALLAFKVANPVFEPLVDLVVYFDHYIRQKSQCKFEAAFPLLKKMTNDALLWVADVVQGRVDAAIPAFACLKELCKQDDEMTRYLSDLSVDPLSIEVVDGRDQLVHLLQGIITELKPVEKVSLFSCQRSKSESPRHEESMCSASFSESILGTSPSSVTCLGLWSNEDSPVAPTGRKLSFSGE